MIHKAIQTLLGLICGSLGIYILITGIKNSMAWNDGYPALGGIFSFLFLIFFAWGFIASAWQKSW